MSKLIKSLFLISILLLSSCGNDEKNNNEINISVSIPPFANFTKQIVGNRANVNTLIPPGVNAHSFEPSPQDLKSILNSDIYFKVGANFDLESILLPKIKKNISIISDCSDKINMINNNPHYWLSPTNVKIITNNIVDQLSKSYP